MCTVAVVGSINADLVLNVDALPKPGETIFGNNLQWLPGGKGANQAIAAARLGAHVRMYATIGSDEPGAMCLATLTSNGVDVSDVSTIPGATGTAAVVVEATGENLIVVVPGANSHVGNFDVGSADVLLLQNEIPQEVNNQAASGFSGFVVYNPAPVRDVPDAFWDLLDLVIVNEHEHAFYQHSRGLVIVTLGERGAVAYLDGVEVARAIPPSVAVVDTVGAGDTFVAACAVALTQGKSVDSALRWAVTAGALATTAVGAQGGMPTQQEVDNATVF